MCADHHLFTYIDLRFCIRGFLESAAYNRNRLLNLVSCRHNADINKTRSFCFYSADGVLAALVLMSLTV